MYDNTDHPLDYIPPRFWNAISLAKESVDDFRKMLQEKNKDELLDFIWTFEGMAAEFKYEPYTNYVSPKLSEDGIDDLATWVVEQGRDYTYKVFDNPELIPWRVDHPIGFLGEAIGTFYKRFGGPPSNSKMLKEEGPMAPSRLNNSVVPWQADEPQTKAVVTNKLARLSIPTPRDKLQGKRKINANKIMEIRSGLHLYDSALKSAVSWLAAQLAYALEQEVTVQDFWFDRNGAAVVTCQVTVTSVRPPFALSWDAVLVLKAYANKPPRVTVTVFLFSGGDRLGRFVNDGSSYLRMSWDDAEWSAPIWFNDVYSEWESIMRARRDYQASGLVSQRVRLAASEIGTCLPKGPFAAEWTLTIIPNAPDQGCVELSILGERVGRLVDGGKSHIAVTCVPSGEWLVEGWQAED